MSGVGGGGGGGVCVCVCVWGGGGYGLVKYNSACMCLRFEPANISLLEVVAIHFRSFLLLKSQSGCFIQEPMEG